MSTKDEKIMKFKKMFLENLEQTSIDLRKGRWLIEYDPETDEFEWYNPKANPSEENSILLPIDNFFSISVNKNTAEIEHFYVQDFCSVYVRENPELKKFANILITNKDKKEIQKVPMMKMVEGLFGKLFTSSLIPNLNTCGA